LLYHRILTAQTYGNLERAGHLYIPIGLSIESHGGDLLEFGVGLKGSRVDEKTQKPRVIQGRIHMLTSKESKFP
jgi:hypothetical protein